MDGRERRGEEYGSDASLSSLLTSDVRRSHVEKLVRHWSKSVGAKTSATPLFHDWPDAKVTSRVPRPRALKTPPVNSHVRSWSSHSP
jgi:hypothetical protein